MEYSIVLIACVWCGVAFLRPGWDTSNPNERLMLMDIHADPRETRGGSIPPHRTTEGIKVTTYTKYVLRCKCGHAGHLRMAENDQPFSKQWEKYSLEGFDGKEYYIEGFTNPASALEQMNASCPKCKRSISGGNLEH